MKFTNEANSNGTSYKGSILTTFSELCAVFGQPDDGPDADMDKVTCLWSLKFEDGTVATLYDWKNRFTPFHEYEWHIGGYKSEAVDRILEAVESHRLTEAIRAAFKALDDQLGCAPQTPPELVAQFNAKLEKLHG